jgi:hypothetical protein
MSDLSCELGTVVVASQWRQCVIFRACWVQWTESCDRGARRPAPQLPAAERLVGVGRVLNAEPRLQLNWCRLNAPIPPIIGTPAQARARLPCKAVDP